MNTHAKACAAYASCFQLLENNYPRRRQKLERQESLITLKILARAPLLAVLTSRGGKNVMSFFALL